MNKTVIIGGVAGGATCAARLRRVSEDAKIVLLERGPYISYANCGLPYHVGEVIKSRKALLLQSPESMHAKFNVDVRVKSEVLSIDPQNKSVTVKKLDTGETYQESYDNLVISTGSSPLRPPIKGINSPRIRTLWTLPDTDEIKAIIAKENVKTASVIGGGFIGLEMAENLHKLNVKVSIIEMLDQVMAPVDYEMAQVLHENIVQNGVELHLKDGVSSFEDTGKMVNITLSSGKKVSAELVILAIGVRPNGELAKNAGLEVNGRGGIVVNENLQTSDPNIYAVGDVIEIEDFISKNKAMIPLAGPANKQGRIVADNIAGIEPKKTYKGTMGTSVAKIFDLTCACTGSNEKALIKRGLTKGKDYETAYVSQNSHAGYYPGALPMTIKLIFSKDGQKIFGAQIVGREGVDKRIDTISAVIRLNGTVDSLTQMEFAYAPPYSSAKDPVNMVGYTAENVLNKLVAFAEWDCVEKDPNLNLLDVREESELAVFSIDRAKHIPLGQIRQRLNELDKDKPLTVFCAVGVRSYNALRILMQNGFKNVNLYPAGTRFYQSTHYRDFLDPLAISDNSNKDNANNTATDNNNTNHNNKNITKSIDCTGLQCPGPIMQVFQTIKTLNEGDVLQVTASDPGFVKDIAAWCKRTKNTLISTEIKDNNNSKEYLATVQKGISENVLPNNTNKIANSNPDSNQGKTIIVFSGDLDKVLASFIIANGSKAMGRPVTMFFTFWGLTALRKNAQVPVQKTFMEKMFGFMLPKGAGKLTLSKMNMGGLGTKMMKKIMADKKVDSLETLIKKAMDQGVKIVACTMSMDVMGIKKEELIEGVELGGVGAYLGDAEESNVNLFI